MTKSEIISHIAEKSGITNKVSGGVLDALIALIIQTLKEEGEIRIAQLGTFKVAERKARIGVNPKTGAKINIPATKVPTFKASQNLKDTVKGS
jgi:DNA-binding protein HU-beta